MPLEHVVELDDGVRIGLDVVEGQTDRLGFGSLDPDVVVTCEGEEWSRYRLSDSISPPCCMICIEDGHDVELDGMCPHGKLAYTRKAGLV